MLTFRRALFPVGLLLLFATYIMITGYGYEYASSRQDLPDAPPPTANWVTQGKVGPVRNQGPCDSGWAFSAAGAVGSADAIFGRGLVSLSEQQLVDCSPLYGIPGCNGGSVTDAFKYITSNGITTLAAYPYTATTGLCKIQGGAVKINGWTNVPRGNVIALQEAVAQQPVSAVVDVRNMQFYSSGIFSNCGPTVDQPQPVLVVGYVQNSYWLVQNSWGTAWGQAGYIQLKWGNTCGIADAAVYPNF